MIRGFFLVCASLLLVQLGQAQTTKTGVLVIGNGSNAIAASIQSAVSGAKTVLLLPNPGFVMATPDELPSGISAELQKRMAESHSSAAVTLKTWTDTLKNLTIVRGTDWIKIKRSGGGWNLELMGGKSIKAVVLVHAEHSGKLSADLQLPKITRQWKAFGYDDFMYRTSVATGKAIGNSSANVLTFSALMLPGQENLVLLDPEHESLAAGQAAGATAAYAAFFKTKTSEAKLKVIQGELLNYKLSLLPFADITPADSNWRAIQMVGMSGFLKAELTNGTAYFRPDRPVTMEEIREPVKSFYYKAQIWFDDHKGKDMSLSTTLDMIAYVGGVSLANTTAEVKKNWKKAYHFNTEFEEKRVVSRREFAVLVNQYLKPFNMTFDKTGKVLR
ncbi:hypothetical protein [Pedobacter sp. GR22-6]|uniref:hypothetical protein n=1 Tax=Pedobacter sp. GR22-6 TaxID=3127957 RepID=UPI00307F6F35